jgi:caffeoyl-CoA O-methyltransferase
MLQDTFRAVDVYIKDRVGLEDQILIKVRESSRYSTMPEASISANQGKFLYILAKSCSAKNILEIGTLVGYSTIWLARALPEGGKIVTIEYDETNYDIACKNIEEADYSDLVTIIKGKALDVLPDIEKKQLSPFDFIFIDADKPPYVEYLNWALKFSRKGSIIVLDNVIRNAKILDSNTSDPKVIGVKKLNDYLKDCKEADFTILQMVGGKDYDGMAVGIVR